MASVSLHEYPQHKLNTLYVLGAYRLSRMALLEARRGFTQFSGYTATISESVRTSYPAVLPHYALFETTYTPRDLEYQLAALSNEVERFQIDRTSMPSRLLLVGLPDEALSFLWLKCEELEELYILRPTSVDEEGLRIFDKVLDTWISECPDAKALQDRMKVVEPAFDEVEELLQQMGGVLTGVWAYNQDYVFLPDWAQTVFNSAWANSKPVYATCGPRQYDPSSHAGFPGFVAPKERITQIGTF